MGVVSDYLLGVIEKHVDKHGIVVWYDPEGCYAGFAKRLELSGTRVERYDGSFFDLRDRIEPLMAGLEPPRLVVYVPMERGEAHNALIEAEAAGVVMRPGAQPWTLNTRLVVVARNGLKSTGQWTEKDLEKIAQEAQDGRYGSIEDVEQIAIVRGQACGILQLIFGTADPREIALKFLSDSGFDSKIEEKGAINELSRLIAAELDWAPLMGANAASCRASLARHVMATDLLAGVSPVPEVLGSVKAASKEGAKAACVELVRAWRSRRDLSLSYVESANSVEKELGVSNIAFSRDQILELETFLGIEISLQKIVEEALLAGASVEDSIEIARIHRSSFWSEQRPEVRARWSLIEAVGRLFMEAERIEGEVRSAPEDVVAIFSAYTSGERPWYLLDSYHRKMESKFHDLDLCEAEGGLERLVYRARDRYTRAGEVLAERFLRLYQKAGFRVDGALRQTAIFERMVRPALLEGKVAYVWVDALRFEMAEELVRILPKDYGCSIEPAIAAIPTITEIGMAALLPGAENATVVPTTEGKLGLEIDSVVLKTRDDRVKFLKGKAGVEVFDVKLDDLLPIPKKPITRGIEKADLILVTSQEIDEICESGNAALARSEMDGILLMLRRAFRILAKYGVKRMVVTADHGHLFGEELGVDMLMDPPGGNTLDLHRRVWVGHGGAADSSYLRAELSDFGLGRGLEIAVPWNFSCFKVKGGSRAYFHGGLSPQELIVPVVGISLKPDGSDEGKDIIWNLDHGGKKLTARFFTAKVSGKIKGIVPPEPPSIRVELREGGEAISKPVSASYGFDDETCDVQMNLGARDQRALEPNTITLKIYREPSQKKVRIHLMNAATGVELAPSKEVENALLQY